MKVSSINNTFSILGDAIKILIKYPVLLLPIFISWIIYAAIVLYFEYYFDWKIISTLQVGLGIGFLIIFALCLVFSISSFAMLEIIQQIETKSKISFFKAVDEVVRKDFLKALPIMLVWAIIWFTIEILELLFSRKDSDGNNEKTYENMAKSLSGYKSFSLSGLTFDLIKSGVRFIVFFIYPSIAWEDEGPINAVKKGFLGIKNNISEFTMGFFSIEAIAVLIFIPAGIMFWLSDEVGLVFSDTTWQCLILYIAFAGSLYLYLQQMFAALLYMWNMKWNHAAQKAMENGMPVPAIRDIKKPDLLDDIPDLL